jgi:hypothetical protein
MNVQQLFQYWRVLKRPDNSWGLAWFLANEFCQRYYSSHGIIPFVIAKEGLGYYGILLESISCRVNKKKIGYGRVTMGGNFENWQSGGPGDHGFPAIEFCKDNMPTEEIVRKAIAYMGIEPLPKTSHYNCRHKRWGRSFELCFEIATILALQYESNELSIWNHLHNTERLLAKLDPNVKQVEHLGAFLFDSGEKKVLLAADGRLLDGSGQNLWHMYMNGDSAFSLAEILKQKLEL